MQSNSAVRQLRLVLHVSDFDESLAFFRDVLGADTEMTGEAEVDARWVILDLGRATLELADANHLADVDTLETGKAGLSPAFRLALEVDDVSRAVRQVSGAGQQVLGEPREMPWGSVNARVTGPSGLQITLFQEQ